MKAVLLQPDIPHRQPVFEQYVRRIRESLLRLSGAGAGTTAVVVSGSGTAANETALSSIVRPDEAVLLLTNGEFGEQAARHPRGCMPTPPRPRLRLGGSVRPGGGPQDAGGEPVDRLGVHGLP